MSTPDSDDEYYEIYSNLVREMRDQEDEDLEAISVAFKDPLYILTVALYLTEGNDEESFGDFAADVRRRILWTAMIRYDAKEHYGDCIGHSNPCVLCRLLICMGMTNDEVDSWIESHPEYTREMTLRLLITTVLGTSRRNEFGYLLNIETRMRSAVLINTDPRIDSLVKQTEKYVTLSEEILRLWWKGEISTDHELISEDMIVLSY